MSGDAWWNACHALSIAFANGVDHRRYDEVAALFCLDGVLDRWGQRTIGRVAIREWLDTRSVDTVTRHVCTNFEARQTAPDRAEGMTLFTFYSASRHDGSSALPFSGPDMVGDYLDQFQLTTDGWRIKKREVRPMFRK